MQSTAILSPWLFPNEGAADVSFNSSSFSVQIVRDSKTFSQSFSADDLIVSAPHSSFSKSFIRMSYPSLHNRCHETAITPSFIPAIVQSRIMRVCVLRSGMESSGQCPTDVSGSLFDIQPISLRFLSDRSNDTRIMKCVWHDTLLKRWAPSGCTTDRTGDLVADEHEIILCHCDHLTDFAVVKYSIERQDQSEAMPWEPCERFQQHMFLSSPVFVALMIVLLITLVLISLLSFKGHNLFTNHRAKLLFNSLACSEFTVTTTRILSLFIFTISSSNEVRVSFTIVQFLFKFVSVSIFTTVLFEQSRRIRFGGTGKSPAIGESGFLDITLSKFRSLVLSTSFYVSLSITITMFVIVYSRTSSDTRLATQLLLMLQVVVAALKLVLGWSLLYFGRQYDRALRDHIDTMKSKPEYKSNAAMLSRTALALFAVTTGLRLWIIIRLFQCLSVHVE